jgi:hypothetical protein
MALRKIINAEGTSIVQTSMGNIENGCIQVRTKTAIKEDGVEISSKFHRHVVVPGADVSAEDAKVQAIAASIHTAEVIAAYQAEAVKLPA